jgi:hypothetical protein
LGHASAKPMGFLARNRSDRHGDHRQMCVVGFTERNTDLLNGSAPMHTSYSSLRQFTPNVLAVIDFQGGPGTAEPMEAVGILKELNRLGGRKVPEGAPAGFVPVRFAEYLDKATKFGDGTSYRHYWELRVLLGLRDGLRSGDIFVPGSRRYADPSTKRNVLAVLTAGATNLGLARMAEACGVPYDLLAWTAEWYVREETLREANTVIVNHHHRLELAKVFGGGTMSSSDGQRFPVHALRRGLHDAHQGTITKPQLTEQTEQAWCLTQKGCLLAFAAVHDREDRRDLASVVLPEVGRLAGTGDEWEPYRLLDATDSRRRSVPILRRAAFQSRPGSRAPSTSHHRRHPALTTIYQRFRMATSANPATPASWPPNTANAPAYAASANNAGAVHN